MLQGQPLGMSSCNAAGSIAHHTLHALHVAFYTHESLLQNSVRKFCFLLLSEVLFYFSHKIYDANMSFFLSSPADMFLLILETVAMEGGREKRTEEKRNISWLPSVCSPTRDQTHNPGMCPDQESNGQHLSVGDFAPTC